MARQRRTEPARGGQSPPEADRVGQRPFAPKAHSPLAKEPLIQKYV